MTDKQIIEPCMGCSALECWGVVDCDVAQRVLALHKTLTEIKVLSENVYCLTNALNRDMALFAKEIIQKISECEGNK